MGTARIFQDSYRKDAEESPVASEHGEIEGKVLCDVHTTRDIARWEKMAEIGSRHGIQVGWVDREFR
jgi:hypothetical protein